MGCDNDPPQHRRLPMSRLLWSPHGNRDRPQSPAQFHTRRTAALERRAHGVYPCWLPTCCRRLDVPPRTEHHPAYHVRPETAGGEGMPAAAKPIRATCSRCRRTNVRLYPSLDYFVFYMRFLYSPYRKADSGRGIPESSRRPSPKSTGGWPRCMTGKPRSTRPW